MAKTIIITRQSTIESRLKSRQLHERRNRILAAVFGVLMFCLLFAIVIKNVLEVEHITPTPDHDGSVQKSLTVLGILPASTVPTKAERPSPAAVLLTTSSTTVKAVDVNNCCTITTARCAIQCLGCKANFVEQFDLLTENVSNCHSYELEIVNCSFENNKITKKSFENCKVIIAKLHLKAMDVREIEEQSFDVQAFHKMKTLQMAFINIELLPSGMLLGLNELTELSISDSSLQEIEPDFLKPVASKLIKLKIFNNNNLRDVNSLIYDTTMANLQRANLYKNFFEDRLNATSFIGFTFLEYLRLQSSEITAIGSQTFDPFGATIKSINLQNNKLTTLMPSLFDSVIANSQVVKNFGNPWNCDCTAKAIKEFISKNADFFVSAFICTTPPIFDHKVLDDTELNCDGLRDITMPNSIDYESVSGINGPTTIGISTVAFPQQNLTIKCMSGTADIDTTTISIGNREIDFEITDDTNAHGSIVIDFSSPVTNYALLWYSSENDKRFQVYDNSINCIYDFEESVTITNLEEDTSYIFCILQQDLKQTSPLNCVSHYIQSKHQTIEEDTWLYKEDQVMIISLVTLGCLLSVLLGGFCVYMLIRHRPYLVLSNNKEDANSDSVISVYANDDDSNPTYEQSVDRFPNDNIFEHSFNSKYRRALENENTLARRKFSNCSEKTYFEHLPETPPPPLPPHPYYERNSTAPTTRIETVSGRINDDNYYASFT